MSSHLTLPLVNWVIVVCLFGFLTTVGAAQSEKEINQGFMDGQAIVKFQDWVSSDMQKDLLKSARLTVRHRYPAIKAYWVEFDRKTSVHGVLAKLRSAPTTKWAQANFLGHRCQSLPNDPKFGVSYALNNTGQTVDGSVGTNDADMDAAEAWDLITDASNTIIAVVDTGCRLNHEDLTGNIWNNPGEIIGNGIDDDANGQIDDLVGWDFLANDNIPNDLVGHGTTVAGCIAMSGNNGLGGTGVCWQTQLMVLKDGDLVPQMAASAASIEYAALNGASVCNFSTNYGPGTFPLLQTAITVAQSNDMLICVAAGNTGINLDGTGNLPATYNFDNLIVVAATDNKDALASFSNVSATHVDLAAPGVSIQSTSRFNNSAYTMGTGTSFSAPLVTGCVGLIRAYNTAVNYQTVRTVLLNSCDQIPGLLGLVASNGRVNVFNALNAIGNMGQPNPPNPNAMVFDMVPTATSAHAVTMVATMASPGPVEYKFDLVAAVGAGGNSSPWTSNPTYVDSGLDSGGSYTYSVRARNAITLAETLPSDSVTAYTDAAAPGLVNFSTVKNTSATVAAVDGNGNSPGAQVAIRFDFLYVGANGQLGFLPYWQPLSAWAGVKVTGLFPKTQYIVRAIARHQSGTFTAYGPESLVATPLLSPSAEGVVADSFGPAEQVMTINGSNGDQDRVSSHAVGDPFVLQVANPSTMVIPANFAILAWYGIPSDAFEVEVPSTFGRGTLCFTPCDLNPMAPSFNLVSTFGSLCGEYTSTGGQLATWTAAPQTFPFPLPELTLQVWIEETPGMYVVGNAMVFRYQ